MVFSCTEISETNLFLSYFLITTVNASKSFILFPPPLPLLTHPSSPNVILTAKQSHKEKKNSYNNKKEMLKFGSWIILDFNKPLLKLYLIRKFLPCLSGCSESRKTARKNKRHPRQKKSSARRKKKETLVSRSQVLCYSKPIPDLPEN